MTIIVLVALIAILIILFKNKPGVPKPMIYYIIMGGFVTGFTALLLGVFGAIILYPESNIAPIIGFLYTGPIGFILGLFGGTVYWTVKIRGKRIRTTGASDDSTNKV
jgi:hypothetical protein